MMILMVWIEDVEQTTTGNRRTLFNGKTTVQCTMTKAVENRNKRVKLQQIDVTIQIFYNICNGEEH